MVIREDMTFMEAVFQPINRNKPSLPYDEFIVDWGEHPIGTGEKSKVGKHFFANSKLRLNAFQPLRGHVSESLLQI